MKIKKIWLNEMPSFDGYSVSIRLHPPHHSNFLAVSEVPLPPVEQTDGKRLNLQQAKAVDLAEMSYVFAYFSREDLVLIRDTIDRKLSGVD